MLGLKKKNKNNEIVKVITNVEIQPYLPKDKNEVGEFQKFPLAQLGSLGLAFEPIMKALQNISNKKTSSGIYRVILPEGAQLAKVRGEGAYIGAAIKKGEGLVGQARFVPVTGNATSAINPAMLCMAVVLMSVQKIRQCS